MLKACYGHFLKMATMEALPICEVALMEIISSYQYLQDNKFFCCPFLLMKMLFLLGTGADRDFPNKALDCYHPIFIFSKWACIKPEIILVQSVKMICSIMHFQLFSIIAF